MKKLFLTTLILFFYISIFAQTEKEMDKKLVDKFEKFYNESKYDSIFAMFSVEMQKSSPPKEITIFLTSLSKDLGKIVNRKFVNYNKKTFAVYEAMFERETVALSIAVDEDLKISGLLVEPSIETKFPKIERNITKLSLPFRGKWDITWGGDTKELNYHVESQAQKNAFDFLIKDTSGKIFKNDRKSNDDYYAFGQELTAPCDGEIVVAVDGVKDNIPGEFNPTFLTGNTVIIKIINNEFLFFAHLKNHSIKVKEGQIVKQGQVLGLCGNSGQSSEPHLHFHIQNIENMKKATGVKCYFDKIIVNGLLKTDYSPIQNEKISN